VGWDIVVPVASVVVSGGVAICSKIIDARSKREDREHARKLSYEGWQWQAKNGALRRLISACMSIKRTSAIAQEPVTERVQHFRRGLVVEELDKFRRGIAGEGVSEITAYAAEPVRDAVDELLNLIEQLGAGAGPRFMGRGSASRHWDELFIVRQSREQLDLMHTPTGQEDDPEARELTRTRNTALEKIGTTSNIDVDEVITMCDRIIDVARQDIQGRY
jgi:hypothetical protein